MLVDRRTIAQNLYAYILSDVELTLYSVPQVALSSCS